ncbi:hypothetical protein TNCV_766371 [Trichonephila clavipes]|nr:hypothetical protein TNCV_766371 [Trichonephila clavipes]
MEEILSVLGTDDNPVDSSLMVLNFRRKRNDTGSFVYEKNGMAPFQRNGRSHYPFFTLVSPCHGGSIGGGYKPVPSHKRESLTFTIGGIFRSYMTPTPSIPHQTTSRWVSSTYPSYSSSPLSVHA